MSGAAYAAGRILAVLAEHGRDVTLKRRKDDGGFDAITVKAKVFSRGTAVDFDGESGAYESARIGNDEIAASSLPTRYPRAKDRLVVDGVTVSIDSVNILRDGDTVLMHVLELIGVSD